MPEVHEVIWPTRARSEMDSALYRAAAIIDAVADLNYVQGSSRIAEEHHKLADELRDHYPHDNPCPDESCPCRKAEADEWRDAGAVKH
jgi:2-methylisocitrate lyase-like PEP mutase family enzyme